MIEISGEPSATPSQPAIFIGHGAPLYALRDNPFTPTWQAYVAGLARPASVLVVSGHWFGDGLAVTAQAHPPTIHDFGAIGPDFHAIEYPAPGAPWLVERVASLVSPAAVEASTAWGLDHGAWTVLMHLWPNANVPVAQLRIDLTLDGHAQIELGRRLAPLRDEGVLILGSGNIVHNLAQMRLDRFGNAAAPGASWNERFDHDIADMIGRRDLGALADWPDHPDAQLAAPTPDHLLPLLIVAGAARPTDELHTITEGFDAWAISMRSIAFSAPAQMSTTGTSPTDTSINHPSPKETSS